jgi:hypothetical protein
MDRHSELIHETPFSDEVIEMYDESKEHVGITSKNITTIYMNNTIYYYGVYQIGDVYARSCWDVGTPSGISAP